MADFCDNLLTIKGSKQDIAAISKVLLYPDGNVHPELIFEYFIPIPEDLEDEEDWLFENWGTVALYYDSTVLKEREDLIEIKFETVDFQPDKVLKKLTEQYPDIDLNCYSQIPSTGDFIHTRYKNNHFEEKTLMHLSWLETTLLLKNEVDPEDIPPDEDTEPDDAIKTDITH